MYCHELARAITSNKQIVTWLPRCEIYNKKIAPIGPLMENHCVNGKTRRRVLKLFLINENNYWLKIIVLLGLGTRVRGFPYDFLIVLVDTWTKILKLSFKSY